MRRKVIGEDKPMYVVIDEVYLNISCSGNIYS